MEAVSQMTPERAEADAPPEAHDVEVTETPRIEAAPEPETAEAAASADAAEAAEAAAEDATDESLPVPVGEPKQRRSLWRRLTRRRERRATESNGFQDMVKSRLDGITLRLESFEHGLARSEARLDARFATLESIESRLAELADIGEQAERAQSAAHEAAEAAREATRTARVAAGVAAVAVLLALSTLIAGG